MHLEIRHLRSFLITATELHFGRASTRLNVTQPALSRTIRQMEAKLGGALFKRTTRNVELTELGATFLESARSAVNAFDAATAAGRQAARGEIGRLMIGHTEVAIFGHLPRMLQRFRERYQNAHISLLPGITSENIERVRNGELDIAFVTGMVADDRLDFDMLWQEESVVVMAAGHRLAGQMALSLETLSAEPFVLGTSSSWQAYRPLVEAAFAQRGLPLRVIQEAESSSALLQLVASNEGITIHPACIRNIATSQVVIRELAGSTIGIETCLVSLKVNQSPIVRNFRYVARATMLDPARSMVRDGSATPPNLPRDPQIIAAKDLGDR